MFFILKVNFTLNEQRSKGPYRLASTVLLGALHCYFWLSRLIDASLHRHGILPPKFWLCIVVYLLAQVPKLNFMMHTCNLVWLLRGTFVYLCFHYRFRIFIHILFFLMKGGFSLHFSKCGLGSPRELKLV